MCVFGPFYCFKSSKWCHLECVSAALCSFCHDNHCFKTLISTKCFVSRVLSVNTFNLYLALTYRFKTLVIEVEPLSNHNGVLKHPNVWT